MLRGLFITLAMLCSSFNLFCQTQPSFKSVDVATFERVVADTAYILLDVRTPAEYAAGHIVGTEHNIDVLSSDFTRRALSELPKDRAVALYCRSGNRSKTAARILVEQGYTVVELDSGFRGWASAGKPTTR